MCNRYRLTERKAEVMSACGFEPPYSIDESYPPPTEIFSTGKKTARFGVAVRRSPDGNRRPVIEQMEWGFPTKIPSKRNPAVKLDSYVTNARNLTSPFWRSSLAKPTFRCLVPWTHFAEPHPERGKGDDGLPKQWWFSLPDRPIGVFAGLWRPTERGPAFAFATTEPNDAVKPVHPKATPAILWPAEFETWLEGTADQALALIRPYEGPMQAQDTTPAEADA